LEKKKCAKEREIKGRTREERKRFEVVETSFVSPRGMVRKANEELIVRMPDIWRADFRENSGER